MWPVYVQMIVTGCAAGLVSFTLAKRRVPRAMYFSLLSIVILLYALGYQLELIAPDLAAALNGSRLKQMTLPFLSALFLLFVCDFFDHKLRSRGLVALLLAFPSAWAILLLTGDHIVPASAFYASAALSTDAPVRLLTAPGPLSYIASAYCCLFTLIGLILTLKQLIESRRLYFEPSLLLLCLSVPPLAAGILNLTGSTPLPFDLSPALIVAGAWAMGIYILRFRVLDWMPYARESVLEHINDGFILIDRTGHFLDANAVAMKYFPALKTFSAGAPMTRCDDFPMDVLACDNSIYDFTLSLEDKEISLRASCSEIDYAHRMICTCVMLYDITQINALVRELNELATHDALTGAYNRGAFFELADHEYQLARRMGHLIAVLMIDLDWFKEINDRYGHQCGDEALARVAQTIKNRLRRTDLFGRYGGEEFIILLPFATREGTRHLCEILRKAVADTVLQANGVEFSITISIGAAVMSAKTSGTLEALIHTADTALYQAKSMGRNQVSLFEE